MLVATADHALLRFDEQSFAPAAAATVLDFSSSVVAGRVGVGLGPMVPTEGRVLSAFALDVPLDGGLEFTAIGVFDGDLHLLSAEALGSQSPADVLGYPSGAVALSEALRLIPLAGFEVQLLVTDVIMPVLNGRELSEQLSARMPNLKVRFMSGYTADVLSPHGVLEAGKHLLAKPFNEFQLSLAVRQTLDDAAA